MAITTTIVIALSALAVLIAAVSKMEVAKSIFGMIGMGEVVDAAVSRRAVAGTLVGTAGTLLASVWVWVIQRQEIIGNTTLCTVGGGCQAALSSSSLNVVPFSSMEFGLFFILVMSVLSFFLLTIYLDHGYSSGGSFLSMGRVLSGIGALVAVWMTIVHLTQVEDSPAVCPLCLIILVGNIISLIQFHSLSVSHSDGTWNDK